jgi:peptidoglycan/LPS O-acetylase OafA/YrhL
LQKFQLEGSAANQYAIGTVSEVTSQSPVGQINSIIGTVTKKRQHFLVLDGLRGIAALSVAIFHGGIIFGGRPLLPRAYLAVDFFFLLSGVVVAYAYEARLLLGNRFEYLQTRVIRLYPMIIVGAVLGISVIATSPGARGLPTWIIGVMFFLAALCLPLLKPDVFPGTSSITPVNGPSWSLFFEIFINVVYGFIAKHLTTKLLIAIVIVSLVAESIGIFRFKNAEFGVHVSEFWWGFARVVFPFFAGVLIRRITAVGGIRMPQVAPALLAIVLLLTFSIRTHGLATAVVDLADIAIVYPGVIILAMDERSSGSQSRILVWLGLLSYPLYIIHLPIFMWLARAQRFVALRMEVSAYLWIAFAIVFATVVALVSYHFYDVPVRASLTRMRKQKSRPVPAGPI